MPLKLQAWREELQVNVQQLPCSLEFQYCCHCLGLNPGVRTRHPATPQLPSPKFKWAAPCGHTIPDTTSLNLTDPA